MDSKKRFTLKSFTDDLVVKILSGVPFKSFCRFKCVCKVWLVFSSDPHYRQMLPKIPSGLLLGRESSVQLVSLSPNDDEIDGALTFLPHHEHLELVDSCNGLVLCKYKSSYTSPHIFRFIVCNPATREWMILPDTTHAGPYGPESPHIFRFIVCNPATREWMILPDTTHAGPYGPECNAILAFDPSWPARFYVLNFQKINKLEVFSSDLSMWIVDKYWRSTVEVDTPHTFIGGELRVKTGGHHILVLGGLERMRSSIPPYSFTIELPNHKYRLVNGCFGQSSGFLQCAFPEEGGRRVAVWSLDTYHPCKWSLKHLLCVQHAFGRDYFDRIGNGDLFSGLRGYRILTLDLEREVILLIDRESNKLLTYNISNGILSEIQNGSPSSKCYYYVACYSKLPE